MKKKKLIILIALLCVVGLAVGAFFLFYGPEEKIAKAENPYTPGVYSHTIYEQSSVTVDGVLDEELWQGKKWWKNTYLTNSNGKLPVMEITAFPTEEGIIVGSVIHDSILISDGERMPMYNSNWELYFGVANVGESLYDAANSGSWNVKKFFIDMNGQSATRYNGFDRAVKVDGELNGSTNGATLEMFIPWQTLGVDVSLGIPQSIGVMPCYRAVLQVDASTSWMSPSSSSLSNTYDMFIFDSNGYQNEDLPGSLLGDGYYGYAKTRGWDISQVDQGNVVSSKDSWQKIYFTQHYGNDFIVEALVIPTGEASDSWPKAGFIFQKPDGQYHAVWLDPGGKDGFVDSINNTKNFPDYKITTLNSDGGWNQKSLDRYDPVNPNAKKQEGVKLTVIKQGDNFWYFADGKYLATDIVDFMDGDVMPGMWSLGMATIYKDASCKPITQEEITSYLNEKGVYRIEASVEGPGGSVSTNKESLSAGEDYQISITGKNGFRVASVQINGVEMYSQICANGVQGTYTVRNVQENQKIAVKFERCEDVELTGTITDGENPVPATMTVMGLTDKSLCYTEVIPAGKDIAFLLPAGTYTLRFEANGYKTKEMTVQLDASQNLSVVLELSDFAQSVRVNRQSVESDLDAFDVTKEHEGKILASLDMGSSGKRLFFDGSGVDFVAQTTIKYTTQFKAGKSYQPDLIAGFCITDGEHQTMLWANRSGFILWPDGPDHWTWSYKLGLLGQEVLVYPNPRDAVLTVAKLGETVYVYLNGRKISQMSWSEIAPEIAADSQLAVGLSMFADKEADAMFTDYSICFDSDEVAAYVKSH